MKDVLQVYSEVYKKNSNGNYVNVDEFRNLIDKYIDKDNKMLLETLYSFYKLGYDNNNNN